MKRFTLFCGLCFLFGLNNYVDAFAKKETDSVTQLKELIAERIDINKPLANSDTLLHMSARIGDLPAVIFLVENGAMINARNAKNIVPLHNAVLSKNVQLVRYLLEKKADPNVQADLTGWTPLHRAVNSDNFEMVKLFVENGADLTLLDEDGESAVSSAYDPKIKSYLQEKMPKPVIKKPVVVENPKVIEEPIVIKKPKIIEKQKEDPKLVILKKEIEVLEKKLKDAKAKKCKKYDVLCKVKKLFEVEITKLKIDYKRKKLKKYTK